jgi:transposase InsO family protein
MYRDLNTACTGHTLLSSKCKCNRVKLFYAKTHNGCNARSNSTGVGVCFADPYSLYQRGANENANGLLRAFLPKRTNISSLTQQELDDIAWELNNRPRKRLGYRTPMDASSKTNPNTYNVWK